jgi:hypothetical protein
MMRTHKYTPLWKAMLAILPNIRLSRPIEASHGRLRPPKSPVSSFMRAGIVRPRHSPYGTHEDNIQIFCCFLVLTSEVFAFRQQCESRISKFNLGTKTDDRELAQPSGAIQRVNAYLRIGARDARYGALKRTEPDRVASRVISRHYFGNESVQHHEEAQALSAVRPCQ